MSHRFTPASHTCTDSFGNPYTYDCQMQRAKADATRMRNEAIRDFGTHAFPHFWRDANTVWQHMVANVGNAARSACSLQTRLARRQAPEHSA